MTTSSKIISNATQSLVLKGLITVSDQVRNVLNTTLERKGKLRLFYSILHHRDNLAKLKCEYDDFRREFNRLCQN